MDVIVGVALSKIQQISYIPQTEQHLPFSIWGLFAS